MLCYSWCLDGVFGLCSGLLMGLISMSVVDVVMV